MEQEGKGEGRLAWERRAWKNKKVEGSYRVVSEKRRTKIRVISKNKEREKPREKRRAEREA